MITDTFKAGDTTCVAVFNDDRTRRFDVVWRWRHGPLFTACLLNPAMLTAATNDHTGLGIVERAKRRGFAGARIVNLFTLRTADPAIMRAHPDPVGAEANEYIIRAMKAAGQDGSPFVAGWGADGGHLGRNGEVCDLARMIGIPLHAFKVNKGGSPAHPARLGYELPLVKWREA